MDWIFLSLIAAVFAAANNVADQYLVRRYFRDDPTLGLYLGALTYCVLLPLLGLFFWQDVTTDPGLALLLIVLGLFSIFVWIPYFIAVKHDDATTVFPLLQLSSVLTLGAAWIVWGEKIASTQLIGALLIVVGGIMATYDIKLKNFRMRPTLLMALCALFVTIQTLALRFFVGEDIAWPVIGFWMATGFGLASVLRLVCDPSKHQAIRECIIQSHGKVLLFSVPQEISYFTNLMLLTVAIGLSPSVGLVQAVAGVQPVLVVFMIACVSRFTHAIYDPIGSSPHLFWLRLSAALIACMGIILISLAL